MSKLEALIAAIPQTDAQRLDLDVTALFPNPEQTVVFVFVEPSTPEMYGAKTFGGYIKSQPAFRNWADDFAESVGLLAVAFRVAESGFDDPQEKAWLLLANLVARLTPVQFVWLMEQFTAAFPHLKDLQGEAEKEKNA